MTFTDAGPTPVADMLATALTTGDERRLDALAQMEPTDDRDRFATLLTIYDLHTAPVDTIDEAARHQHHPAVSALKTRCERGWLNELEALQVPGGIEPRGLIDTIRALAARDRLPGTYRWLARQATWDEVVAFLALEGGPDAGFDDLVAACQIGLTGAPKMELAINYWDEMGNGDPASVHTILHARLVAAVDMPRIPRARQPVSALARAALGGLLATNRWLQPEMLGALGLVELQAGPRCRLVLAAFDRCGAPRDAYPFYEVHAEVDPRHGRDWLDKAIAPTIDRRPDWGPRIVRGALWRSAIDAAFMDSVAQQLGLAGRTAVAA